MLVTRDIFPAIMEGLYAPATRALDTETTGLNAYKIDELFSIVIADNKDVYYFDFNETLPRELIKEFKPILENPDNLWFMHNAKFDLSMLYREGLVVKGTVHCTQAIARVEYNAHLKYSLAACAERIGLKKDDAVEKYISEHKLYEWEQIPGKKQRSKNKFYTMIPLEIMLVYGEQDARVTYELGMHQIKAVTDFSNSLDTNLKTPLTVMENERRFTKTCFNIERTGVLIDTKYCKEASEFETKNMEKSASEFYRLTGVHFCNSSKTLAPIFKELGEVFPKTEKGNDSFTEDVLNTFSSPAAQAVKDFRKSEKRAAYFYSYLYHADKDGIIHADIKQSGTETGRISYGSPNFQNVPKRGEDDSAYPVRRAIIPRKGFFFLELDLKAAEYRLMIDYAGELELADKVNLGLDVHTACQEMMGLKDRDTAKTMNFMKLYGGGVQKLATSLNISFNEAQELSNLYWQKLPMVGKFIKKVSNTAKTRGYIVNWFGRVCNFPNPEFSYAAPNHLIQGGCADAVKLAMNRIDEFLTSKKSRMILQVHDSILFEINEEEIEYVGNIVHIFETAYTQKKVPLLCDAQYSRKSWGDMGEEL